MQRLTNMTALRPTTVIRKHFGARLRELGFTRLPGLGSTWVRPSRDGGELLVEIMKERWFNTIHVHLVRRQSAHEERIALSDVVGSRGYDYGTPDQLEAAVSTARAHFDQWGVAWLAGEPITSPALEATATAVAQHRYARLIREAREAFKLGDYGTAATVFQEAAAIAPLNEASSRFLQLAQQRAAAR